VLKVDRIIVDQSGLIARRQALGAGLSTSDIARRIRRREWAMVHPGVFVDHTGELSWLQRAWAAVLFSWPAALCHESAIRAAEGPGRRDRDDAVVHVAVARSRNLVAPPGVRLHRSTGLLENVRWNLGPPRVRYEDAPWTPRPTRRRTCARSRSWRMPADRAAPRRSGCWRWPTRAPASPGGCG
jgi:hypothetical protein